MHHHQKPFLQQEEKRSLVFRHWIYTAALAEKGKERGGEKKKKSSFDFQNEQIDVEVTDGE